MEMPSLGLAQITAASSILQYAKSLEIQHFKAFLLPLPSRCIFESPLPREITFKNYAIIRYSLKFNTNLHLIPTLTMP
jgi:hypothetical protein